MLYFKQKIYELTVWNKMTCIDDMANIQPNQGNTSQYLTNIWLVTQVKFPDPLHFYI